MQNLQGLIVGACDYIKRFLTRKEDGGKVTEELLRKEKVTNVMLACAALNCRYYTV